MNLERSDLLDRQMQKMSKLGSYKIEAKNLENSDLLPDETSGSSSNINEKDKEESINIVLSAGGPTPEEKDELKRLGYPKAFYYNSEQLIEDNEDGYLRVEIGHHLMYRFEVVKILGKGSFAQVV